MAVLTGTGGDDQLVGTGSDDTFIVDQGGNDDVQGLAGNYDTFLFGATLTTADRIDGGGGFADELRISGADYDLTFTGKMMVNIEWIVVGPSHTYRLQISDKTVGAGQPLTVDGESDARLLFDGHRETDGYISINSGSADDVLIGGQGNDGFNLNAGNDRIRGEGGDDLIQFDRFLSSRDKVDGGDGFDTVNISGDYSAGVVLRSFVNVEKLILTYGGSASYNIVARDTVLAAGQTLTIDAYEAHHFVFNGGFETDGHFYIRATLTGADDITGGAASDTFDFRNSYIGSTGYLDTIRSFDFSNDLVRFQGVSKIGETVDGGSFSDLQGIFGKGEAHELARHSAVLFHATEGGFAGDWFLIVQGGGLAGYHEGSDLVLHLVAPMNVGEISISDFIG